MKRTILLTGATGAVSTTLLQALEGADVSLRALVRDPSKAQALTARGVAVVQGDLDDPESLPRAFEGVNDLWLLNAVSPRQPENSMNAVWAARRAGVERVVRMSAIGAAHDAPSRNGRLHALSDAELIASGLKYTILRPHFFMQNLLGMAPSIKADGAFYWDMGQGKLGMIDVRDIGAFAARVLTSAPEQHHGKIYTLTGPASVTFDDAAAALGQALGKPVRYVAVPHEAARKAMLDQGFPSWLAGMMIEYATAYSENWGNFTTPHVQEVVGRPPYSIADFVSAHVAAFSA
jgi:uncharacterized protein YbjT (DUF2867 family)